MEILAAAEEGRTVVLRVRMANLGPFTAERRAELQRVIDAIEFDPLRACGPDYSGKGIGPVGPKVFSPRKSVVESPAAPAPSGQFSFMNAMQGAGNIQRMFVPVMVMPNHLDDAVSLVVDFETGKNRPPGKTVADYTRKFAETIAATYCSEVKASGTGDTAFPLDFATEDPSRFRRFDCEKFALGAPVQRSRRPLSGAEFKAFVEADPVARPLLEKERARRSGRP